MTDDAFLQTIRESPDDDGPRLVYADWLEERGDPRGEFIRVQCELARLEQDGGTENRESLRARERELLRTNGMEWLGRFADWMNDQSFTPCFERGFIERIKVDGDVFVGDFQIIGDHCPLLRSVVLYGAAEFSEGLALCPLLGRLCSLEIADWLEYDQALMLANSRHVAQLESISVWVRDYAQSLEVGMALIDAPALKNIKLLHLYDMTYHTDLPDDETRWRNRVQDELNERTMADRGEIFHVVSSSDRFFCIRNDPGRGIYAGKMSSRFGLESEYLGLGVTDSENLNIVLTFDRNGNVVGHARTYTNVELEPCTVRVRQFVDPCGLAVHQFPSRLWRLVDPSPEFYHGMSDRLPPVPADNTRSLHEWIESGSFVVDWRYEFEFTDVGHSAS